MAPAAPPVDRAAMIGRLFRAMALLGLAPAGPASAATTSRVDVVVELFTAQGCAACPPAQALVNALAGRPDILALSFSVTYWDALGWRDGFAQPAFTERQRRYATVGRRQLATPQVILNGRIGVVGNDSRDLERAIRTAALADPGPAIEVRGRTMTIGADRRTARVATVWLVDYDPRTTLRCGSVRPRFSPAPIATINVRGS